MVQSIYNAADVGQTVSDDEWLQEAAEFAHNVEESRNALQSQKQVSSSVYPTITVTQTKRQIEPIPPVAYNDDSKSARTPQPSCAPVTSTHFAAPNDADQIPPDFYVGTTTLVQPSTGIDNVQLVLSNDSDVSSPPTSTVGNVTGQKRKGMNCDNFVPVDENSVQCNSTEHGSKGQRSSESIKNKDNVLCEMDTNMTTSVVGTFPCATDLSVTSSTEKSASDGGKIACDTDKYAKNADKPSNDMDKSASKTDEPSNAMDKSASNTGEPSNVMDKSASKTDKSKKQHSSKSSFKSTKGSEKKSGSKTVKKKKTRKVKESSTEQSATILNYLKEQNRPFNPNTIFENLKRGIPLTALKNLLDLLVEGDEICSTTDKSRVYWINQSVILAGYDDERIKSETSEALQQVKFREDKIQETHTELASIRQEIEEISAYPPSRTLSGKIEEVKLIASTLQTKVDTLVAEQQAVSRDGIELADATEEELNNEEKFYLQAIRNLKPPVEALMNQLLEGSAVKQSMGDLAEEIGVELSATATADRPPTEPQIKWTVGSG